MSIERDLKADKVCDNNEYNVPENTLNKLLLSNRIWGFKKGWDACAALAEAREAQFVNLVRELMDSLTKAQSIIVEDECPECNAFIGVRYEVKPIKAELEKARSKLTELNISTEEQT